MMAVVVMVRQGFDDGVVAHLTRGIKMDKRWYNIRQETNSQEKQQPEMEERQARNISPLSLKQCHTVAVLMVMKSPQLDSKICCFWLSNVFFPRLRDRPDIQTIFEEQVFL